MKDKCPKTKKQLEWINCSTCKYFEYIKSKVKEQDKVVNVVIEYRCNYLLDKYKYEAYIRM